MKATGIVRRIDDLGRVVIPKEIRRTLHIKESDPLEIFTDRDPTGVQAFDQNFLGKLTWRHRSETLVEIQKEDALDAAGTDIEHAVTHVDHTRKIGAVFGEEFFGMRFESDRTRQEPTDVCRMNGLFKQGLVTAVHTIEIADGNGTVELSPLRRNATKNFHKLLKNSVS